MNGGALDIITGAAVFRGELSRMLLALCIVAGFCLLAVAFEVWRDRRKHRP